MLKNKPSPTPVTARPVINMGIVIEPASNAAPVPNTTAPIIMAYIRPSLSARAPARKEAKAAGIRIVDTIRPCKVDDTGPKDSVKDGIVVMGPIVPVSRLRVRQLPELSLQQCTHPNRQPPIDTTAEATTYCDGFQAMRFIISEVYGFDRNMETLDALQKRKNRSRIKISHLRCWGETRKKLPLLPRGKLSSG